MSDQIDVTAMLRDMQAKAQRWDAWQEGRQALVSDITRIGQELESLQGQLNGISRKLNPEVKITVTSRKGSIDYPTLIPEWFEKVKAGVKLTYGMLEAAYPEWTPLQLKYFLMNFRKCAGIEVAGRGPGAFYFYSGRTAPPE